MNEVLINKFAEFKYFQSRWLTILIGLSKIFHAAALMWLYMWSVSWDEKFSHALFFVSTASLTYFVEYGITHFWWPNYIGTFTKDGNENKNLIVCAHTPFYSGKYHISVYVKEKTTFFQRLGAPVVESSFGFEEFFTESGFMLENIWKQKVDSIFNQAISKKTQ